MNSLIGFEKQFPFPIFFWLSCNLFEPLQVSQELTEYYSIKPSGNSTQKTPYNSYQQERYLSFSFNKNDLFQKMMERDKRKEVILQKKAHQDEEKLLKAIQDRNIRVLGSGTIFSILHCTF